MDGASEFRVLFQIVVPLIKPALAVIALFFAVFHWNSWFDTLLYASGNKNLHTLQYKLMLVLKSAQTSTRSGIQFGQAFSGKTSSVTTRSLINAMTVIAVIPIIVVYPFLQRYFVSGLILGGLKG
jgi:putative aldouronate transport system permease protein